jgi:hypothetical protein
MFDLEEGSHHVMFHPRPLEAVGYYSNALISADDEISHLSDPTGLGSTPPRQHANIRRLSFLGSPGRMARRNSSSGRAVGLTMIRKPWMYLKRAVMPQRHQESSAANHQQPNADPEQKMHYTIQVPVPHNQQALLLDRSSTLVVQNHPKNYSSFQTNTNRLSSPSPSPTSGNVNVKTNGLGKQQQHASTDRLFLFDASSPSSHLKSPAGMNQQNNLHDDHRPPERQDTETTVLIRQEHESSSSASSPFFSTSASSSVRNYGTKNATSGTISRLCARAVQRLQLLLSSSGTLTSMGLYILLLLACALFHFDLESSANIPTSTAALLLGIRLLGTVLMGIHVYIA